MKKILVIGSLLVVILFLVSCAPQMTDEELEAELAKLTPEEREALIKDLETQEKGAFAGQAVAKYSPKLAGVSKDRMQAILQKPTCTDSDGGKDYFKSGATTNMNLPEDKRVNQDECRLKLEVSVKDGNIGTPSFFYYGEPMNCDKYKVGSIFFYKNLYASGNVQVISVEGCELEEVFCLDANSNRSETINCPYGCSNGACLPQAISSRSTPSLN